MGCQFWRKMTALQWHHTIFISLFPCYLSEKKCLMPSSSTELGMLPLKEQYHYNESIVFTCNRNWRLEGSSTTRCKEDGTWTVPAPECLRQYPKPYCCPLPYHVTLFDPLCHGNAGSATFIAEGLSLSTSILFLVWAWQAIPDSKIHGANMGPIWV